MDAGELNEWDAQGYETDEEEDVEEEEVFGWDGEEDIPGSVVSLPVHRTRREWLVRRRWRAFRINHRHSSEVAESGGHEPLVQKVVNVDRKPSSEAVVEDLPKVWHPSVLNGLEPSSSPKSIPSALPKDASGKHQKIHKRRVVLKHGNNPRRRFESETKVQKRCDGNHESDLLSETNVSDNSVARQRRRGFSDGGVSENFESCLEELEGLGWASEDMATALEDNDLLGMDNSGYFTCKEELDKWSMMNSPSMVDKIPTGVVTNVQTSIGNVINPPQSTSAGAGASSKSLTNMVNVPSSCTVCTETSAVGGNPSGSCQKSPKTMSIANKDLKGGSDATRKVCKYTGGLESLVMNQLNPVRGSRASSNTSKDLDELTLSSCEPPVGNYASGVSISSKTIHEDLPGSNKGINLGDRHRRRRSSAPDGTNLLLEALRKYSVSWDETELLEDRVTVRRVSVSLQDGREVENDLQIQISKGYVSTEDLRRWGSQEKLEVNIKRSSSVSDGNRDLKELARSAKQCVQEQLKATVYVRKGGMIGFGGGTAVYTKDSWSERPRSNKPDDGSSGKLRRDSETSGFSSDLLAFEASMDEGEFLGDEVSWGILNRESMSSGR